MLQSKQKSKKQKSIGIIIYVSGEIMYNNEHDTIESNLPKCE